MEEDPLEKRLLVLDVEGTLFESGVKLPGTSLSSTIWQGIARLLGKDAEDAEIETHRLWTQGTYSSYTSWMDATYEIHRKHGLTATQFDSVISAATYIENVEATLNSVDRTRYIPVLVSGGFRELARRAQIELQIQHAFCGCEYFFDREGSLIGRNLLPADFTGKLDFVRLMLREHGLGPFAWVFVGDGKNDVPVASAAPISFGYKSHEALIPHLSHQLDSFSQLLDFL